MTDRTGGPSAPNYVFRWRPENYDEDEEINSSGEDVANLSAVTNRESRNPLTCHPRARDLALAKALRLRADSLEKVVSAMLVQPPPDHPTEDDFTLSPPTSPKMSSSKSTGPAPHQHTLPNGVRVRLALGTLINDLFARIVPSLPPSHQFRFTSTDPQHRNHNSHSPLSNISTVYPQTKSFYLDRRPPEVASIGQQHQIIPTAHVRTLYDAGSKVDLGNSPTTLYCSRHLHIGCEICTSDGAAFPTYGRSDNTSVYSTGSAYLTKNPWKGMPGGMGPGGGGISGWLDESGVGSGLSRPGADGDVLRRCGNQKELHSCDNTGSKMLPSLIHRFLRLSALVAVELAMEAIDDEEAKLQQQGKFDPASLTNTSPIGFHLREKPNDSAFLPTQEWYMLLAGLLTRAVLEGYLVKSWRGVHSLERLLTIGLRKVDNQDKEQSHDPFQEFNPDGLPSLAEAINILFSFNHSPQRKNSAFERYEAEMLDRLHMFYKIPATTPSLCVHLKDLAIRFPAEPVERAAVRFCESVSRWRGKPELERSKRAALPGTFSHTSTPSAGPFHLVSRVTNFSRKHKSSIDVYFVLPPAQTVHQATSQRNKRLRSIDDSISVASKRIHFS